ncbi:MAG: type II toxin-antitoxin system PemK/MazF family toxin [Saprospiraceae bacterium]|nr:type II toxin-antitoxin system PemK/MazF family toxin [Saprospiraceae bacterium]
MEKISLVRGEIWLVNLDATIGAEIQKKRPAVIISSNAIGKLPLKVIVPITEWKAPYAAVPWMVRIQPDKNNGLDKESAADTFQIRSVSNERFIQRIGILSDAFLQELVEAITTVVSDL